MLVVERTTKVKNSAAGIVDTLICTNNSTRLRDQDGLNDICCRLTSCLMYGRIFQISGVTVQGVLHICLAVGGGVRASVVGYSWELLY